MMHTMFKMHFLSLNWRSRNSLNQLWQIGNVSNSLFVRKYHTVKIPIGPENETDELPCWVMSWLIGLFGWVEGRMNNIICLFVSSFAKQWPDVWLCSLWSSDWFSVSLFLVAGTWKSLSVGTQLHIHPSSHATSWKATSEEQMPSFSHSSVSSVPLLCFTYLVRLGGIVKEGGRERE